MDKYWHLDAIQKRQVKALEDLGWRFYRRLNMECIENWEVDTYIESTTHPHSFDEWKFIDSDPCYIEAILNQDCIFSFITEWQAIDDNLAEIKALSKSGFDGIVAKSIEAIKAVNAVYCPPQLSLAI